MVVNNNEVVSARCLCGESYLDQPDEFDDDATARVGWIFALSPGLYTKLAAMSRTR